LSISRRVICTTGEMSMSSLEEEVAYLRGLGRQAAKALRNHVCPDCDGSGEIVRGDPDNERYEYCRVCTETNDLIERLDPPKPRVALETSFPDGCDTPGEYQSEEPF
jgi:hypothetical protein